MNLMGDADLLIFQVLNESKRKFVYRVDHPDADIDSNNLPAWGIGPMGTTALSPGEKAPKGTMFARAMYAADRAHAAMYARPRNRSAHPTNYVSHIDHRGRRVITFDAADKKHIRNFTAVERAYLRKNFRNLKSGEWVSGNPGEPVRTRTIKNPLNHMRSTGLIVRFTDDLDKHAEDLQRAGINAWMGTEK